jgi:hypothetical protein
MKRFWQHGCGSRKGVGPSHGLTKGLPGGSRLSHQAADTDGARRFSSRRRSRLWIMPAASSVRRLQRSEPLVALPVRIAARYLSPAASPLERKPSGVKTQTSEGNRESNGRSFHMRQDQFMAHYSVLAALLLFSTNAGAQERLEPAAKDATGFLSAAARIQSCTRPRFLASWILSSGILPSRASFRVFPLAKGISYDQVISPAARSSESRRIVLNSFSHPMPICR